MPRIPKSMRAAAIDRFGGPKVLKLRSMPVPRSGAGGSPDRSPYRGVGTWDLSVRDGSWAPERTRFPLVLGTDGGGTVVAVGSRSRRFRVGDKVYAYRYDNPKGGFYAEYVAVRASNVGRVPAGLSPRPAGALAATGLTAIQGVDDALHVKKGEAVIIHGASGNVGSLALQFAKLRGARVLATASG